MKTTMVDDGKLWKIEKGRFTYHSRFETGVCCTPFTPVPRFSSNFSRLKLRRRRLKHWRQHWLTKKGEGTRKADFSGRTQDLRASVHNLNSTTLDCSIPASQITCLLTSFFAINSQIISSHWTFCSTREFVLVSRQVRFSRREQVPRRVFRHC